MISRKIWVRKLPNFHSCALVPSRKCCLSTIVKLTKFLIFFQSEPETEDKSAKEVKKEPAKRQISEAADDVLKIDCSEEVDEFTEFLNEFEDELKPKAPKVNSSQNFPDFPSNHVPTIFAA